MGGNTSSIYTDYPDLLLWKRVFEVLALSEAEVKSLYRTFCFMDVENTNFVNVQELVAWLSGKTPFMTRVFSLLDVNKCGRIDFGEFTVALWNFLSKEKNDLIAFVFDMYDSVRCGSLQTEDLQRMLFDIYGRHMEHNKYASKLCFMLSSSEQRHFDVTTFTAFVTEFPALLYPVFLSQQRMRASVIGNRFWRRMAHNRSQRSTVPSLNQLRQLLIRCEHSRRNSPKINASLQQKKLHVTTMEHERTVTARCDEGSTCVDASIAPCEQTPLTVTSTASYYFPEQDASANAPQPSDFGIRLVKNASRVVPVTV